MNRKEAFKKSGWQKEWLEFKKNFRNLKDNTCEHCGKKEKSLHVHHLDQENYDDLDNEKFLLLCCSCHNIEHGVFRSFGYKQRSEEWLKKAKEHGSKWHSFIKAKYGEDGYLEHQSKAGKSASKKRWGDYEKIHLDILEYYRKGVPIKEICILVGRGEQTVYNVIKKNKC